MDFLENVKNVVGSAAQSVVKKSGEVVGYSKIKYAMFDLSNSIKSLNQQIGEAVYESYEKNTPVDEGVKDLCAKIQTKKEQLAAYAEQLESYKSIVKCTECGKGVKSDCSYCPFCGTKLSVDAEAEFCSNDAEYYSPSQSEPIDDEPDSANSTEE